MSEDGMHCRPSRRRRSKAKVDYVEMSVKYGSIKIQVPHGFKSLLEHLSREILREQPKNIPEFAAAYFRHLLQKREEGHADLYLISERIVEARTATELEKSAPVEKPIVETQAQDLAHEPDQAQEQEMPDLADKDVQKAAVMIQSSFRGFQLRKSLPTQSTQTGFDMRNLEDGCSTSAPNAAESVKKEALAKLGGSRKCSHRQPMAQSEMHNMHADRDPVTASDTALVVREKLDAESDQSIRRHSELPRTGAVKGPTSKKQPPVLSSPAMALYEDDSLLDDGAKARIEHTAICQSDLCHFEKEELRAAEIEKAVAAEEATKTEPMDVDHDFDIDAYGLVAATEELVVQVIMNEEESSAPAEDQADPFQTEEVSYEAPIGPVPTELVESSESVQEAPTLAEATEALVERLIQVDDELTQLAEDQADPFGTQEGPSEEPETSQDDEEQEPAERQAASASERQAMGPVEHPTTEQDDVTVKEPSTDVVVEVTAVVSVEDTTEEIAPEPATEGESTSDEEATFESEAPAAQEVTKEKEILAEEQQIQASTEEVFDEDEKLEVPTTEEQQESSVNEEQASAVELKTEPDEPAVEEASKEAIKSGAELAAAEAAEEAPAFTDEARAELLEAQGSKVDMPEKSSEAAEEWPEAPEVSQETPAFTDETRAELLEAQGSKVDMPEESPEAAEEWPEDPEELQEEPAFTDEARAELLEAQGSKVDMPEESPEAAEEWPEDPEELQEEPAFTDEARAELPEARGSEVDMPEGLEAKTDDTDAAAGSAPEDAEDEPEELDLMEELADESDQLDQRPQTEEGSHEEKPVEGTPI